MQPPLLPEIVAARVERLGRVHGLSVLYVAGFFALISAVAGDKTGAIFGLFVAGAGAVEHHGSSLLRQRRAVGVTWLAGSQLFLFVSIAAYCAIQITHVNLPPVPEYLQPMVEANAAEADMKVHDYLVLSFKVFYGLLLVLSAFYQGGLGLYYLRRRGAVTRALAAE